MIALISVNNFSFIWQLLFFVNFLHEIVCYLNQLTSHSGTTSENYNTKVSYTSIRSLVLEIRVLTSLELYKKQCRTLFLGHQVLRYSDDLNYNFL